MKENCFDEGTIQAFLDGELSSDILESVARHVALCDDCSLLLNEAEEESAFAFELLGDEFNSLVPTERIRANVYQAISQLEKPKVSLWQKLFSFKVLSNPSIVAFASLLVVFGLFATVLSLRNNQPTNVYVAVDSTPKVEAPKQTPIKNNSFDFVEYTPKSDNQPKPIKAVYREEAKPNVQNIVRKAEAKNQKNTTTTPALEGETTYLKTIATLETTVNAKKDNVLRASSRVSYERDMAVIEDSIKRMKEEVRKNPKNEAAKQILRNSYQNKIELLNSVTERSELMARLD